MKKPDMLLKWSDEQARPISRASAAKNIRANRIKMRENGLVKVARKFGETYIASEFLGVGCVIFRADRA